jgi:nucleoside-diphosphate-sugar epimerase
MSSFLITGGAGFIGSNLAEYLLQQGHRVRVLDNFSTGKKENIAAFRKKPGFELVEGDLRDYNVVIKAGQDMEFILHQGALPSVPRSILDPVATHEVNVLGTLHVLQSARENKVRRVIYASSSSVYGNNPTLPKQEDMKTDPLSPYAISKAAAEKYCRVFYDIYGLETVSLRYFNVFGPRQDRTSEYSAVIPKFIETMQRGKRPVIFGDGLQSRDFTYVDNAVGAILLACKTPGIGGRVYNIACGERYRLIDLVSAINSILETNIQPEFSETRKGDVKHSLADISRAQKEMGYRVSVKFTEGLRKTLASMGG